MKSLDDILNEVLKDLNERLKKVAEDTDAILTETANKVRERLDEVANESLRDTSTAAKKVTEQLQIVAQETNKLLAEAEKEIIGELKSVVVAPAKPKPIEYIGGVMDEETRPLLKSYIQGLQEGEGVLVIYRRDVKESSDLLLESNIQQISGHDWNYVTGKGGESKMQTLVDKLSTDTMALRSPNIVFSQGDAKIKAFDNHQICFGIVGNSPGEITSIKGVVHQQLNMGLNGDLLLHEGDIIIKSLLDNGVLHEGANARPLKVKTYGAGGSASHETTPGIMAVSDGVIDIRTHVHPTCIIDYLEKYVTNFAGQNPELRTQEHTQFDKKAKEIKAKIAEIENGDFYTGIDMVHDMAELNHLAAAYTGENSLNIMKGFKAEDKRYYGEITFGTINTGVHTVQRIDTYEEMGETKSFIGNDGQKELLKQLQSFLSEMSNLDDPEKPHEEMAKSTTKKHHEEMAKLIEQQSQLHHEIAELDNKILNLLVVNLNDVQAKRFGYLELEIEVARREITMINRLFDKLRYDPALIKKLEDRIVSASNIIVDPKKSSCSDLSPLKIDRCSLH